MIINLYCNLLNINLLEVSAILHDLFPNNTSSLIENQTVYLSEGVVLDCSIEKTFFVNKQGLYLTGQYKKDEKCFIQFIDLFKDSLTIRKGIYSIEYEIDNDGVFVSYNLKHPDFDTELFDKHNVDM